MTKETKDNIQIRPIFRKAIRRLTIEKIDDVFEEGSENKNCSFINDMVENEEGDASSEYSNDIIDE